MPENTVQILVVDDDSQVRLLLRSCFEREGYGVLEAKGGAELRAAIEHATVSLITLDLNLGGEDGLALAREIRAKRNVPIIMITGKGETIDRVVGLELGADDYIAKPFHVREVLARVRAVLRRYEAMAVQDRQPSVVQCERFTFEGWVLDPRKRELKTEKGEARELTTAEFDLLRILVERPNRVLSRDNIMDLLKGHEWSPLDRSIDALVARLRKKIEPVQDEEPHLIKTVRGVGYFFAVPVRKI
jgi:two-component system, OmpR family, response regulator